MQHRHFSSPPLVHRRSFVAVCLPAIAVTTASRLLSSRRFRLLMLPMLILIFDTFRLMRYASAFQPFTGVDTHAAFRFFAFQR